MQPALHRTIMVVDVEGFGDRRRTNEHQITVRAGLYRALQRAFAEKSIPWAACHHEDRGDGVLLLATPDIPKTAFTEKFPQRLAEALREHNDGRRTEERIRLRMALHAGEVHYDDHGVTSTSINLAFQLLDAPPLKAALSESDGPLAVIASSWFFDEVVRHSAASTPADYRPVRVTVKEAVTVAWVCLPDQPHEPSPGRRELELAPVVMKRTLPRDTADFTGRSQELAQLLTAATAAIDTGRTVIIHAIDGMAGVGKTALAVHLGHLLTEKFPDGQLFLRLHAHTAGQRPVDSARALASLLSAIGVNPSHIPADLDARAALWRDQLADRKMLMIFDDAAGHQQVEPLLPATPGCLALVTSRRRLSALDATMTLPLDTLPPDQAVALLQRLSARAADSMDADQFTEIVRLAGYLPLAISLLARRLRHHPSWSVEDLVTHLRSTLERILDIRAEDVAIASAFDLSYRNLPANERRFFRYLGLHPGPEVDIHSAAALANVSLADASRCLDTLYADHLLDESVPGRYRMHDLVRDYAGILTRRVPHADREKAMDRMLDYYQETAGNADERIHGDAAKDHDPAAHALVGTSDFSTRSQALSWMHTECANLIASVEYAARHGQHERVIGLAKSMNSFLWFAGPWDQAIFLHRSAANAGQSRGEPRSQAYSLNQLGELWRLTGHFSEAIDAHTEALEIYRSLATPDIHKQMAATTSFLGVARMTVGDLAGSIELHTQALDMFRELDYLLGEAIVLNELATTLRIVGDHRKACDAHEQALTIYSEFGNVFGKAFSLYGLGTTCRVTGDIPRATEIQEQALEIYRSLGHRIGEADALNELGLLRGLAGDMPEAEKMQARALEIYHELGHPLGQAETLNNKGSLLRADGDHQQAKAQHQAALRLARGVHSLLEEARALNGIAECELDLGNTDAAVTALRRATSIYRRIGAAEVSAATSRLAELRARLAAKTPDKIQQLAEAAENARHGHVVATWAGEQHPQPLDIIQPGDDAAIENTPLKPDKKIETGPGERTETETACEPAHRSTTTSTSTAITPSADDDAPATDRLVNTWSKPDMLEDLLDNVVDTYQRTERPIRMGFMLDIVDYGRRDSPAKESLQRRLAAVTRLVLDDLAVAPAETERQGTGDGVLVVLPARLDVQRALPVLLQSMAERLALDNTVSQDRMRVRMTADIGPVGLAELGFSGAMVTNMGRLLDSKPLRKWVTEHRERDLAVAVSDSLHRFVVAEGVPALGREQFTRVHVRAKELTTVAWLWIGAV
jgi:tetratricopeptide (TPR) repeat protein